ncbi:hypothetical protein F5Y15DRAFT_429213 [Xylariaceae sp. FL0016]|nr:hypothetical protein F5Y15DRAFT_429213 [Xylariaceae sp. FL0016]
MPNKATAPGGRPRPRPRSRSPSPSHVPLPASPTFSYASSTANPHLSSLNLALPVPPPPRPVQTLLTKGDLAQSQQAYADLLATAKTYRQALAQLSTAASAFGCALEACARLKEARAEPLFFGGYASGPPTTNVGVAGGGGGGMSGSFLGGSTANPHHQRTHRTPLDSCTANLLLSASGVHHLVANHQQILSETVYRSFEVPLLHELDAWRGAMADEDESYSREVTARSREIRKLEKDGLKLHRQRRRDVGVFREHLVSLTTKLDGLTDLHGRHAATLLRESQGASAAIVDASCSLVRAEVDIFEGLARKGWSGGGLDDLLERGTDLFAEEEGDDARLGGLGPGGGGGGGAGGAAGLGGSGANGEAGAKLFSILPPRSILADSASASDSGGGGGGGGGGRGRPRGHGHGRSDSLLVENDRYQSLAGAVERERADTDSIFSEFNQSRGVRPFSPQPIRRRATDVVMDPESLLSGDEDDVEGARDVDQDLDQDLDLDQAEGKTRDEDADAVSPWKDEGLGKESESLPKPGLIDAIRHDHSSPTERERRWSCGKQDE